MVIMHILNRVLLSTVFLVLMGVLKTTAKTVYMDRYGDCFHEGPMEVEGENYVIQSSGGDPYDTLMCAMTFKSLKDDRLCLNFVSFSIRRCDIQLTMYSEKDASSEAMGTYTCHNAGLPENVCSRGKYLTVLMRKKELSHDGYDFTLEVRHSKQHDTFTEGIDAFIVSISLIVGIIVGVIVIVVITAVIIVCCCCKTRHNVFLSQKSSTCRTTGYTDVPVQPSAPPLPEDPPGYYEHPPPYSATDNSRCEEQEACDTQEKALV